MTRVFGDRTLRQKLTLVALVTVVAAQICAAIVLIGLERSRARRMVVEDLQTVARIVVDNTAAALSFEDPDAAAETLRALGAQEGFERACVYDQRGRLFASFVVTGECGAAPMPEGYCNK